MSSDPIEVLRELVQRWRKEESRHEEGMNSVDPAVSNYHEGMSQAFGECADELESALASLSAPKPPAEARECPHRTRCDCLAACKYGMAGDGATPAEAQPVAWVRWHAEHGFRWRPIEHESRSSDVHGYVSVPLYTAPPSAPVGVEGLASEWEKAAGELNDQGLYGCCAGTYEHCAAHLRALAQQPAAVDEAMDKEISVWAGRMSSRGWEKKWPEARAVHNALRNVRRALAGQQQGGES